MILIPGLIGIFFIIAPRFQNWTNHAFLGDRAEPNELKSWNWFAAFFILLEVFIDTTLMK